MDDELRRRADLERAMAHKAMLLRAQSLKALKPHSPAREPKKRPDLKGVVIIEPGTGVPRMSFSPQGVGAMQHGAKPLASGSTRYEIMLRAIAKAGPDGITRRMISKQTGIGYDYVKLACHWMHRYGGYLTRRRENATRPVGFAPHVTLKYDRHKYTLTRKGESYLRRMIIAGKRYVELREAAKNKAA